MIGRNKYIIGAISIVLLSFCFSSDTAFGQDTEPSTSRDCIRLRVISQKYYDASKHKKAPDVIDPVRDNVISLFRLTNNCTVSIFYLSYSLSKGWVGFMLYNDDGKGWQARSSGWGREGIFSDPISYGWVEMKPGTESDFEATDLSTIPGKRSFAAYVNYKPVQDGRFEVHAEEYCAPIIVYKK